MPFSDKLQWVPIASAFPASLDTTTDTSKLKDGYSPDVYGQGLDVPGALYKAACITGTAPIKKTYTIGLNTWTWYFRRLWRSSTANLHYNAPEYVASELAQDLGVMSFDEDANAIVTFFPFANDAIFVGKTTGGYRVPNADSMGGRFQHGDIVEAMKVPVAAVAGATHAIELDGIAYASNASGLFAWDGTEVTEVTAPCKISPYFSSQTLTIDERARRLVLGTAGVYEPSSKRLFPYSGSNFRFTTRTFTIAGGHVPFPVKGVAFVVDNVGQANGSIKYQVKRDQGWENEVTLQVRYSEEGRVFVSTKLDNVPLARQFALRITDMTGNIRIREISIETYVLTTEGSRSQ